MFTLEETETFTMWVTGLRDREARARILRQTRRLAAGNFGDVKPVGEGVSETRLDYGSGYRIYWTRRGAVMVMLLCGGTKKSQRRDIETAKALARRI